MLGLQRMQAATVAAAITQLPAELRPEIWHQAGRGVAEARAAYAAASVEARIDEFIDDMSAAYQWADLVVARSGALTVAELAMIGVGNSLVPTIVFIESTIWPFSNIMRRCEPTSTTAYLPVEGIERARSRLRRMRASGDVAPDACASAQAASRSPA